MKAGFHFPAMLCSLGVSASWSCALCLQFAGRVQMERGFLLRHILKMSPVGLALACTLVLGNRLYLYLSIAFIQVLKATGPLVTYYVLQAFGLEIGNLRMQSGLAMIALGSAATCVPELRGNTFGILIAFTCELSEGLRVALLQALLVDKKLGVWQGISAVSPSTLTFLIVYIYLHEYDDFLAQDGFKIVRNNIALFVCAGVCGVFVNVCTLGVIQHAGAVALKVLGQFKSLSLVCITVVTQGDTISYVQFIGYVISLAGFQIYSLGKERKMAHTVDIQKKQRL